MNNQQDLKNPGLASPNEKESGACHDWNSLRGNLTIARLELIGHREVRMAMEKELIQYRKTCSDTQMELVLLRAHAAALQIEANRYRRIRDLVPASLRRTVLRFTRPFLRYFCRR